MKKIILFSLTCLGILASCKNGTPIPEYPTPEGTILVTLSANKETLSKTFVDTDGTVCWEEGDKIAVFDGVAKREFTIVSHSGKNADFRGYVSADATQLYAVYPFEAGEALNPDGTLSVSLPCAQIACANGVDPKALLAVAKTTVDSPKLDFKNVTSLARVEIESDGVSQICLKGATAEQIAGLAKASPDGSSVRVQTSADNYMVSLSPGGDCFAKGVYYLAVYPSELAGGPVVELTSSGKIAEKSGINKLTFKRSVIANLGDVTSGLNWKNDGRMTGNTVNILCLGNSFSEDACEEYLFDIFKAGGITAIIGNGYVGGCDLPTHWNNANNNVAAYSYRKIQNGARTVTASQTVKAMLQDENWDYIVVQQGGGNQGFYDTYKPYLANLIAYCRENAAKKDFKVIFHYNWSAAKDCTSSKFAKYDYDQMKMYRMQAEACAQADAEHGFDLVANTGDAIQSGRTSYLGDSWNRDGWHLKKTYGRYCASCLFYERISGKSSIGLSYCPSDISPCVASVCQNAAHCAALYKYQYVDLSWIENTDPAPVENKILASWLFDKTVSVAAGHQASWTGSSVALGVQAKSNAGGLVGYVDANAEGSGRISYYQIDKSSMAAGAARYILNGSPGGQPAVCGQMGGDYWLFETTGKETFSEGDHLYATFTVHPGKYGAKYWLLEYLDGEEWKPVGEKKTKTLGYGSMIDVDTFEYNLEMTTNTKKDCVVDIVLTAQTKAFTLRLTCCSTYQVNGKYWLYPNNPSEFRIAGTQADENLPVMKLLFQ